MCTWNMSLVLGDIVPITSKTYFYFYKCLINISKVFQSLVQSPVCKIFIIYFCE